ncbi:membrane protein insertase YidC [bacterium]|nr:membrane protein insertase YidC [bacterium]
MNLLLTNPSIALILLQSNEAIGRAVGGANGLPPDYGAYGGITGAFGQIFLWLITWCGTFIHNYGLAIMLTALVVRIALLPLTRIQIRGMRMMQQLQPVMKEIQRHYPNKQDQSAKTMELYSRFKINPLAGCLPMLIQLPILFGVYRALYDPTFAGKDFLGIQLLFPVNVTSGRSFGLGPELSDLIDVTVSRLDLMHQIIRLPDSIPLLGGSFWYLPALILVVFYVASSLLMQRVMRKVNAPDPEFIKEFEEVMKTRKHADEKKQEPDLAQQMQKQMGIMNFVIIIFAFIFSAGALLYFVVQNILMMLEYQLIPKYLGGNGTTLDARELRQFIRQPPAPPQQPGVTPRPGPAKAIEPVEAEDEDDIDDADADEATLTSQEDADEVSDDQTDPAVNLTRPRKKRRKR